jgi:Delta3-Delta2-enoyl-CoA isomerase
MPELTSENEIYLLNLGEGENRFSPPWIAEVAAALDVVANAEGPRALVTVATGKYWSNGLDLDWLGSHPEEMGQYVTSVQALFARLLTLPAPSIAVLQGHTYAAGAMLALSHDSRIMRADRGFFCLPEVNIGIPFTAGMSALIQARLSPELAHEAMTTGRRYGGQEAEVAGIVASTHEADALTAEAKVRVRGLTATAGPTLAAIRTQMYERVIGLLASV